MTMAAAMQSRTAEAPARSKASRIAHVDIVSDPGEAEPVWRALEDPDHLSTPYQRFDLLSPWLRLAGGHEGARPFIVIGRDAEHRPLALLPLVLRQSHGVRTASFMGGKHTTFNMGLWNAEFAAQAAASDLDALFAPLREHADVLALTQQPLRWHDQQNPFALLRQQSSINGCPLLVMEPGGPPASRISNSFRRRLKSKEKKLQALAGVSLSPRHYGPGRHPPARLVFPRQAGADGGTETAERVRRAGCRTVRPLRLPVAARRRPHYRHPCARMR
ncbi:CelD/BcsL family acetyltransferase involved in cellulose biosynthesis [Bradyrhizobium sp. LM2.7]